MVREQASLEVAEIRQQLEDERRARQMPELAEEFSLLSGESLRQEMVSLEDSLAERQRELGREEQARHMLEDQLEDANMEIDNLRRELELRTKQFNEAVALSDTLQAQQFVPLTLPKRSDASNRRAATDLRDARLCSRRRPLDLHTVVDGCALGKWIGVLFGVLLTLGGLELVSYLSGHGELITWMTAGLY